MKRYINYDLRITQQGQLYDLRASCPLAGQAASQCQLPFSAQDIKAHSWIDSGGEPQEIGQRLYDAIFQDEIGLHLHKCLAAADAKEIGLRIRLHLSAVPQLASLPWEYLYDVRRDDFFALSTQTPIVRYLDVPTGELTMAVEGPIDVLAILANPTDMEPYLAVDQEWNQIQAALQSLEQQRKIKLHRLPEATTLSLQRYLRRNKVDILHFIGHGQFDEQSEEGLLVFENQKGQAHLVSADVLARLLKDKMPRLVYLNSCDSARTSLVNPLTGTAQELVLHGVPAVVAMQCAVQDESAIQIANEFYLALMDGYPVDAALAEGRKAVLSTDALAEWGTPVLFMRAPDGQIFENYQEIIESDDELPMLGSLTEVEGEIRQQHRILVALEDRLILHRQTTNSTQVHAQIERQRKHLQDLLRQYWSQVKMVHWPIPPDIRAMIRTFDLTSK